VLIPIYQRNKNTLQGSYTLLCTIVIIFYNKVLSLPFSLGLYSVFPPQFPHTFPQLPYRPHLADFVVHPLLFEERVHSVQSLHKNLPKQNPLLPGEGRHRRWRGEVMYLALLGSVQPPEQVQYQSESLL
jgi:hypothetical protein